MIKKYLMFGLTIISCLTVNITNAYADGVGNPLTMTDKAMQWRSMENGKWSFNPIVAWYHINIPYTGSYGVGFKESLSTVGRFGPTRVEEDTLQSQKLGRIKVERDTMALLLAEDLLRAADRLYDRHVDDYRKKFDKLSKVVDDAMDYCRLYAGTRLSKTLNSLDDQVRAAKENFDLIGKSQLESAKRRERYEASVSEMQKLADAAFQIARLVKTFFVFNPSEQ